MGPDAHIRAQIPEQKLQQWCNAVNIVPEHVCCLHDKIIGQHTRRVRSSVAAWEIHQLESHTFTDSSGS